jgi:hypothetical protein
MVSRPLRSIKSSLKHGRSNAFRQLDEKWGKGWYRYAEALEAQEPKNQYLIAETCMSLGQSNDRLTRAD